MATRKRCYIFLLLSILSALVIMLAGKKHDRQQFDGNRAYQHVLAQVAFGPRIPGSISHTKVLNYIISELTMLQWQVSIQTTSYKNFIIQNIIASRGCHDNSVDIILGAHYDSRILADQDTDSWINQGVPGANDGASGVAVLLELARTLPINAAPTWLVFFDAEDNGGIIDREWSMGARAFVNNIYHLPQSVVIVDMVGDADLDIYFEGNSNINLAIDIWEEAARLGFTQFHQEQKYSIIDDHIPFVEANIQAVDIIDFDYPYWHTHLDTPDKVSPESLRIVGETLWNWIMSYNYRK